ncbi:LysR family transcriptional regulator [Actibacterium sp. MT2.3-13A]|uniref:LysR family transcriptional regulator n=1 Tax=Actibacterium sp. MT2.3-13A TaxID=2828332 RepID=UPI001BAAB578|nr:LysR family transcriptional regulator [Actibacterium sp. MT2.3-13A]
MAERGRFKINIKQLKYLRQIIESGSISAAAEELHVAQTALGIQVRNLEEELGVTLIERHSRGIRATPSGELMHQYAVNILAHIDEAKRAVRSLGRSDRTVVKMGVTPSLMRVVGDDIVMELQDAVPEVSLKVVEELSFVQMQLLEQGELHCALSYAFDPDPKYSRWPLLEEELYCLNSPGEGVNTDPIPFSEMLDRDLATTGRWDSVCRTLEAMAARIGKRLNVAYEVQSIRAVKNLVQKGAALTVMPYGAAAGEIQKGTLIARPIVAPPVVRTLLFLYSKESEYLVETPHFRDFIHTIARRMHEADGPMTRLLL